LKKVKCKGTDADSKGARGVAGVQQYVAMHNTIDFMGSGDARDVADMSRSCMVTARVKSRM